MSPRATAGLAAATLVLAGLVAWLELGGGGGAASGPGAVFPGLDPAAVESIAWVRGDDRVRAARVGPDWQIVEPLVTPADPAALDAVARGIASLARAGSVEDPVETSVYGLGFEATRLVIVADGRERSFSLGRETPLGRAVYASVDDRPDVVDIVPVQQAALLDRDLDSLRDRRVLDLDASAATRLRVAARVPAGGFEATVERDGGAWRIVAPAELEADAAAVERLVSDLSLLRAERFVDAPGPREDAQLAAPAFVAEVEAAGAVARIALAPPAGGESLRLVRGRQDRVFLVRAALVAHLPEQLFALRAKAVSRFDPEAALAVELVRDGVSEMIEEPGDALLQALAKLDATSIVAEALGPSESAALGLAPARLELRVLGEGGVTLTALSFGRADPARGQVVRADGRETVFRVDPAVLSLLDESP